MPDLDSTHAQLLPTPLTETMLQSLIAEVDNQQVRGIILGGSQARGDATPYSDVDLACFMADDFRPLRNRYFYRDSRLIGISSKTLNMIQEQLTDPYKALWVVPSIKQARVLLDKDGSMAQLKRMVEEFRWESIREEASGYAGHILHCDIEFAHKLLGGLWQHNSSGVAYAIQRIFDGATMVMALFHGVFITTGHVYYQQVEEAVGLETDWTRYHRLLIGLQNGNEDATSIEGRAKLALQLYCETAAHLWASLSEQRREVVGQGLQLIKSHLLNAKPLS